MRIYGDLLVFPKFMNLKSLFLPPFSDFLQTSRRGGDLVTTVYIMSIGVCFFLFVLIRCFVKDILDDCSAKQCVFSYTLIVIAIIAVICIHNFFIPAAETTVISMVLMTIAYFIDFLFFLFASVFFSCVFDDACGRVGWYADSDWCDWILILISFVGFFYSLCTSTICLCKFYAELALIKAAIG